SFAVSAKKRCEGHGRRSTFGCRVSEPQTGYPERHCGGEGQARAGRTGAVSSAAKKLCSSTIATPPSLKACPAKEFDISSRLQAIAEPTSQKLLGMNRLFEGQSRIPPSQQDVMCHTEGNLEKLAVSTFFLPGCC